MHSGVWTVETGHPRTPRQDCRSFDLCRSSSIRCLRRSRGLGSSSRSPATTPSTRSSSRVRSQTLWRASREHDASRRGRACRDGYPARFYPKRCRSRCANSFGPGERAAGPRMGRLQPGGNRRERGRVRRRGGAAPAPHIADAVPGVSSGPSSAVDDSGPCAGRSVRDFVHECSAPPHDGS